MTPSTTRPWFTWEFVGDRPAAARRGIPGCASGPTDRPPSASEQDHTDALQAHADLYFKEAMGGQSLI